MQSVAVAPSETYPGAVIVGLVSGSPLYGVVAQVSSGREVVVRLDGVGPVSAGEDFWAPPMHHVGRWAQVLPLASIFAPVRIVGCSDYRAQHGCRSVLVVDGRLIMVPMGTCGGAQWLGRDASLRLVEAGLSHGTEHEKGAHVTVGRETKKRLTLQHRDLGVVVDGHYLKLSEMKAIGRALGMKFTRAR